jgi:hypothetical protein
MRWFCTRTLPQARIDELNPTHRPAPPGRIDLRVPWTGRLISGGKRYDLDHLVPLVVYPMNDLWNLVPADHCQIWSVVLASKNATSTFWNAAAARAASACSCVRRAQNCSRNTPFDKKLVERSFEEVHRSDQSDGTVSWLCPAAADPQFNAVLDSQSAQAGSHLLNHRVTCVATSHGMVMPSDWAVVRFK